MNVVHWDSMNRDYWKLHYHSHSHMRSSLRQQDNGAKRLEIDFFQMPPKNYVKHCKIMSSLQLFTCSMSLSELSSIKHKILMHFKTVTGSLASMPLSYLAIYNNRFITYVFTVTSSSRQDRGMRMTPNQNTGDEYTCSTKAQGKHKH